MNLPATNVSLAFGLPAAWYHDPQIYERERQAVFRREWIWLGRADQLSNPGDYIASEFAGWRLFAIRDRDGALHAFHNVCRHRGAPILKDGPGRCDVLRCGYHGWTYDTAGRLRATPHFGNAVDFDKKDFGLHPIRVATWRGFVFVNLAEDPVPLVEGLGDLCGKLNPIRSKTIASSARKCSRWTATGRSIPTTTSRATTSPASIRPSTPSSISRSSLPRAATARSSCEAPQKDGAVYSGTWLWRYPNMTLSTFPGGMNISRIVPLGPRRVRQYYNFLFADTSPDALERHRRTMAWTCNVIREDFAICEGTQANLEAGIFTQGPLSPRHEDGVRYYHELLRRALA